MARKSTLSTRHSAGARTPKWANITFYILFGLLTMISTWVYSTSWISNEVKPEISLIISVVTPFLYLLKKAFRVVDEDDEAVGI